MMPWRISAWTMGQQCLRPYDSTLIPLDALGRIICCQRRLQPVFHLLFFPQGILRRSLLTVLLRPVSIPLIRPGLASALLLRAFFRPLSLLLLHHAHNGCHSHHSRHAQILRVRYTRWYHMQSHLTRLGVSRLWTMMPSSTLQARWLIQVF